jgi:hypothetical protein
MLPTRALRVLACVVLCSVVLVLNVHAALADRGFLYISPGPTGSAVAGSVVAMQIGSDDLLGQLPQGPLPLGPSVLAAGGMAVSPDGAHIYASNGRLRFTIVRR